jgi:hypothetical protein
MAHRDGKMLRGSHTTCSDLAGLVFDIAVRVSGVNGIALGVLQNGCGNSSGTRRVKFTDGKGCILLSVRQASSVQELRVYTRYADSTRGGFARP